ncbi:UPF0489 family protein [Guptibacillus hwajinpoensis]|uniref:Uncharacterized protein n=1 Tax=Guptibacillus hwajinpoensis TaxID=208199 RepID=A0A0J6CXW3_9BACL|nr:UPF0489 family protein [Alkalihalobacillus macyae]KMM37933.1 hypothetical protein AB986_00940 [Alkalihalobacillus macyae]
MDWKNNDGWKKVFPKERIFLMKHHNWAFIAWDLALDKGWVNKNATLFHIDQHLDAAIDGAQVPGLLKATGLKELSDLTASTLGNDRIVGIDNFIWAGVARETIQRILYVSPEENEDLFNQELHLQELKDCLLEERIEQHWGMQWESIEMLEFAKKRNLLNIFTKDNSLILDLDLDYFAFGSQNESGHTIYKLKNREEIQTDLRCLKNLYSWDAITIAISPEDWYIGGQDNAEYVLNLFLEEFHLDLTEARDWSVLKN